MNQRNGDISNISFMDLIWILLLGHTPKKGIDYIFPILGFSDSVIHSPIDFSLPDILIDFHIKLQKATYE